MTNNDFYLYNDRNDRNYLKEVSDLLSFENLVKTAITDKENENPCVRIKFCGLSAMTLLGGGDSTKDNPAYKAFIYLISNKSDNGNDGIVTRLNKEGIAVQIKLLFAYPYSDFYYDLVQVEQAENDGSSIDCIIKKDPSKYTMDPPRILDYDSVTNSSTFKNLQQSLSNLDNNLNRSLYNNNKLTIINNNNKNQVNVKFTPVHGLCCFMQINNTVFLDPYLYAKNEPNSYKISLISPIVKVEATRLGQILTLPNEEEQRKKHEELNQKHYYSTLSHFRYLWNHDLTLYITDVIEKNRNKRITIKKPNQIDYRNKAKWLSSKIDPKPIHSEIDIWKQTVKDDFKRYTSKFHKDTQATTDSIKLFIVGAWVKGQPHECMKELKKFLDVSFKNSEYGLNIKPDILNASDGEYIQDKLYSSLKNSHAACVIQTADICENGKYYSRPNVYLEKGYLLHHLGEYENYTTGSKRQKVFTFKQIGVDVETDNINTGYTDFLDKNDFKLQLYRILYMLWETTELNSEYTLKLMKKEEKKILKEKKEIENKNPNDKDKLDRVSGFLTDIKDKLEIILSDVLKENFT